MYLCEHFYLFVFVLFFRAKAQIHTTLKPTSKQDLVAHFITPLAWLLSLHARHAHHASRSVPFFHFAYKQQPLTPSHSPMPRTTGPSHFPTVMQPPTYRDLTSFSPITIKCMGTPPVRGGPTWH